MSQPIPSNSALRAELGTTLTHLQQSLGTLTQHLLHHTNAAWVWHPTQARSAGYTSPPPDLSPSGTLELITDTIAAIKYTDDQSPHDSRIAPGIVAVDPEAIPLAEEVNRLKRALASVLVRMQGRTDTGVVNAATGERGERPLREIALEAFFFRRLHHWQATRELTILRTKAGELAMPEYIGFTWSSCRDIRRTTREALIEQLKEKRLNSEDHVLYDRDLRILNALPRNEPLALVRPGHTKPVANIAWPAVSGEEPQRQIRPAVLPLFMVGRRLPERLRKLPSSPTPKHLRRRRTDIEIEPEMLLTTLPAHRYGRGFRATKRNKSSHRSPRIHQR